MRYLNIIKSLSSLIGLGFLLTSMPIWARNDAVIGTWYHDNRPTSIQPHRHNQYVFCNENGNCAQGQVNYFSIQVPGWNVNGNIQNGQVIMWSNGTEWTRTPSYRHHNRQMMININGRWYHHGSPTMIQVQPNGRNFVLINEDGQANPGFIQGNTLIIPSLGINGVINHNGRMISWSNQTVWNR